MSIIAASADVATTTIRGRLEAVATARRLVDDCTPLAVFLDDVARHYQRAISDLEDGIEPSAMIPAILGSAAIAQAGAHWACYVALVDTAQALGVQIEFVSG